MVLRQGALHAGLTIDFFDCHRRPMIPCDCAVLTKVSLKGMVEHVAQQVESWLQPLTGAVARSKTDQGQLTLVESAVPVGGPITSLPAQQRCRDRPHAHVLVDFRAVHRKRQAAVLFRAATLPKRLHLCQCLDSFTGSVHCLHKYRYKALTPCSTLLLLQPPSLSQRRGRHSWPDST